MKINNKQKTVIFLTGFMLIFWLILFLSRSTAGFFNNLFGLIFALVALLSGAKAVISASDWVKEEMIRKGLLLSGIGLMLWGFGSVVWEYYSFIKNIILPYPSFADIFYLPGVLLYSLGVIYFARATFPGIKLKNSSNQVFVVTATIIVSVVSYYFLVTIARDGKLFDDGNSIIENFLNILYPCMDFVGLTIAVLISGLSLQYIVPRYKISLIALTFGLVLMFVSDSLITYLIIHGLYYNGCLSDLFFSFAVLSLSFGVLGFSKQNADDKLNFLKY